MRRLIAQVQPVLTTARLATPGRSALGGTQLARERLLQRPQRRRLRPGDALVAPYRSDVAAQPQVGLAEIGAQLNPSRAWPSTLRRSARGDPTPQRALPDAESPRGHPDLLRPQTASLATGDEICHDAARGQLAQLALALPAPPWPPARSRLHPSPPSRSDATPPRTGSPPATAADLAYSAGNVPRIRPPWAIGARFHADRRAGACPGKGILGRVARASAPRLR